MNTKILKYELFTLFFLTITTLIVFYYRDTLPDSYLSISSQSEYGFFAYYSTSFLNFINYYSGPWVLVPCVVFTSFYVLVFSKRADVIDAINIFSLLIFSLLSIYFIQPSMLGAGRQNVCRPAISNIYFEKEIYNGPRDFVLPEEKFLASFTNNRVIARGEKGNMFFVDLRKLSKGYKFDPSKKLPNLFDRIIEKLSNLVN